MPKLPNKDVSTPRRQSSVGTLSRDSALAQGKSVSRGQQPFIDLHSGVQSSAMSDSVLEGLHVLMLEDDAIISMSTQDILEEMGCQVIAVLNLKAAFAAIERKLPGAAVLDVNIGEDTSYEFAEQLRLRGVPFVFLSGYDLSSFGPQWTGQASCQKPCHPAELRGALMRAIRDAGQAAAD